MKKLIITVLMLSLLLASCSDKNGNETGNDTTNDTSETTVETDSNLGDNDGDGGYYRIYCIGGCQESKSGNQRREQAVFVHE